MNKKRQTMITMTGYIGFFLLTAAIIMAGVLIYSPVAQASGGNEAVIAGVMLAVIVVLAFICTLVDFLRRKYTVDKPVQEILDGVKRMASGDFSAKLSPSHTYENYNSFDLIKDHINTLAEELSETEIFRNDFIANVSHEIKTPLSVIRNYACAIQKEDISDDVKKQYAQVLTQAADRLSALVTNILSLNKLENQKILPRPEKLDVSELLRERIVQLEDTFEKKDLDFDCDIDDITAYADAGLLEIVWNNLLSNAIKFTPAGGEIFISLKEEDRFITLSVKDTGCGMSAETGEHIFDKFYQGDTSHSSEGNGLGLALVKKVVDILGGEIGVESSPGKGSTFTVKLRKAETNA